jgi:hypothetical protein
MSKNIDTNVNSYTAEELMAILGIESPDEDLIIEKTQEYIDKFEEENNDEMVSFFENLRDALLRYSEDYDDGENSFKPSKKQTSNWIENQYLKQNNETQDSKITERKQKIDVYGNEHVPMKRDQLGINNNFNVDVAQDVLNPNLKNTTQRLINLDSQYRQVNAINGSSTDYVLDLSESILDVLSIRLYSFQIPYSWYTVDYAYSNTCFWISFTDSSGNILQSVTISVAPGNYTTEDASVNRSICYAINASFISAGFTFTTTPITNINPINGLCTMNLFGGSYNMNGVTYTIDDTTLITFFDPTNHLSCNNNTCSTQHFVNQTLGWLLGFRVPEMLVIQGGNTAIAIADFFGPKYLILVIDDYNQNHINSGLIGITEYDNNLKLPSYYSPDLPYACSAPVQGNTNLLQNSQSLSGDPDAGTLIMEKYNATYKQGITYLPSAPRTLTQSQLYTINEILKNNEKNTNYRTKSPTSTDTLAIIPMKRSLNARIGDLYVDFGGSLQDNKRTYFGPVNLERLHVKLLDDKGNLLNLNGADWSITLICENLYQY